MPAPREIAKKLLNENQQLIIKKNLHQVGLYGWPTSSYEVWLILQNLLFLIRPGKLVELGSGRSTHYLAEYASKFKHDILSIEQSLFYFLKVNIGLRSSFLPSGIVKHVPVRGDWYSQERVTQLLSAFGEFDFIMIDGPAEFTSAKRDSEGFYKCIFPQLSHIKMALVDDVHRENCDKIAKDLTARYPLKRYDISYNNTNSLAFLIHANYVDQVQKLPSYLQGLLKAVD